MEYIKGEDNIADGFSRYYKDKQINELTTLELTTELKEEILREYHKASGHGSCNTMKFMISQKYRWKSMYKDIENFCSRCRICLSLGGPRINTKNKIILSERPNQLWEIDLMGRMYDSGRYSFIFVVIDHYSKWVETKTLTRKTGKEIIKAIEELIIRKHGIPEKTLTDNGLEFDNREVLALQEKYNFKWKFGSPYHHQTTGAVKRVNQTLRNKLKKLTNFGEQDWSLSLDKATLATNQSYNRAIGTSSYIFKYGKQLEMNIDRKLGIKERMYEKQQLINMRDRNFETYKKSIEKGKITIKERLEVDDNVLIYRDTPGKDKLASRWIAGYTVVKKNRRRCILS